MPTLDWIGKKAVLNHHNEVPFHLLRCNPELSVGEAGGDNLLVQGDNLLALKALLPYYAGQVKCIYIDPPYNTGNEGWVYNDNVNSPEIRDWLGKVVGGETEDLSRHDKWLCMMYPRLVLLREMLREDGSFWMNLDDNEAHFAKILLDEIFGPRNFVANVIWEKSDSPKMDSQYFSLRHDHLLVFAKSIDHFRVNRIFEENVASHYNKVDLDGRSYYLKPLRAMGGQGETRLARPNLYYPLIAPDGSEVFPRKKDGSDGAWRWSKEKVATEINRIEWIKSKNGWSPYFRIYSDTSSGRPPETIWKHEDVGSNRTSKAEINSLFPDKISFNTPKPTSLIIRILQIATNKEDLILDSFAGSGTTGHSVLLQNSKDNGQRKFILIEMDENIAKQITSIRLNRVINGYGQLEGLGSGFRYCELGPTLFDSFGQIRPDVSFADLARHVFFTETGQPLPGNGEENALLGISNGTAVYLLYNGVMRDAGNVLNPQTVTELPPYDGPKVVYADGCKIGRERLRELGITFKQIPYQIKVR